MPHNRAVDAELDAHETQPAAEESSAPPERRGLKSVSYGWRITLQENTFADNYSIHLDGATVTEDCSIHDSSERAAS